LFDMADDAFLAGFLKHFYPLRLRMNHSLN
jgi:hypothetical protein